MTTFSKFAASLTEGNVKGFSGLFGRSRFNAHQMAQQAWPDTCWRSYNQQVIYLLTPYSLKLMRLSWT